MKVRQIDALAYGAFDRYSLDLSTHGPVVLLGRNEAGKSTLRRLLQSLFFGFQPARKERHPDMPWSGDRIDVRALLEDDRGAPFEVQRRLQSRPEGRLRRGTQLEQIGNRPLPLLHNLDRRVFASLYALDLVQLEGFENGALAEVLERLAGGDSIEGMRPPREVLQSLRAERRELVRFDQRGKPREKLLQAELARLRRERGDALETEQRHRQLRGEQADLLQRSQQLQGRLHRTRTLARLAPLARTLQQIAARRRLAQQLLVVDSLASLPADPRVELQRLEEEQLRVQEQQEVAEHGQACLEDDLRVWEQDQPYRQNREELDELLAARRQAGQRRKQRAHLAASRNELEVELQQVAAELFVLDEGKLPPGVRRRLLSSQWSNEELRLRLRKYREARKLQDWDRLQRLAPPSSQQWSAPSQEDRVLRSALPLILAALLLAVQGWRSGEGQALLFAAGALLVAAVLAVAGRGRRRAAGSRSGRGEIDEQVEQSRRQLRGCLTGLPLRAAQLEDPESTLVQRLQELQRLLRERRRWLHRGRELVAEENQEKRKIRLLASRFGLTADAPIATLLPQLKERRAAGEMAAVAALRAQRDLAAERRRGRALERSVGRIQEQRADLSRRVLAAVRGTDQVEKACAKFQQGRELLDQIQLAEQDLRRTHAHLDDLEAQVKRISTGPEAPRWSPAEEEQWHGKQGRLQEELQELERRQGEIQQELSQPGRPPAELDCEIAEVQDQVAAVHRQHDRLYLMELLLSAARRRFRDQHQPDVVRRAEEHLRALTEGRYDTLVVDEEEQSLHVSGPALGPAVRPAQQPLSRGTLDQVQLSLRLALAAHFDAERGESLPLILDEALVNFDAQRLTQALRLLGAIGRHTQVILLSCHPWFAERARLLAGAELVSLDRRGRVQSAG